MSNFAIGDRIALQSITNPNPNEWLLLHTTPHLEAIADYPDLYAAIGVQYGGDGRTTFALPRACADWVSDGFTCYIKHS